MKNPPLAVSIIAWLLIAAGTVGFVYHALEFRTRPFPFELLGIELIRLLAVLSGTFLLRGRNWARWLAVSWIALHVAVSFFHSAGEVAMHALLLVIFAILLFRPGANAFFRNPGVEWK